MCIRDSHIRILSINGVLTSTNSQKLLIMHSPYGKSSRKYLELKSGIYPFSVFINGDCIFLSAGLLLIFEVICCGESAPKYSFTKPTFFKSIVPNVRHKFCTSSSVAINISEHSSVHSL